MVLGEARTGLGAVNVEKFVRKVNGLLKIRPELRKKRVMKIMYAVVIQPQLSRRPRE